MKSIVVLSGLAFAGVALADCKDDLAEVDKLSAKVQAGEAQRAQLSQQREAALLLMASGKDDLCQEVVNGMEDTLRRQQEANQMARERNEELQEVKTATPVPTVTGVMRASKVIGLPVKNKNGDDLGVIEDIAIDASSGVIAYVALTRGGFLGLGEKWIAVPWRRLARTGDEEAIVLEINEKALEKMTGFDQDKWPQSYGAEWRAQSGAAGPVKAEPPPAK